MKITKKDFKDKYKNNINLLCMFGLDINNDEDDDEIIDIDIEDLNCILAITSDTDNNHLNLCLDIEDHDHPAYPNYYLDDDEDNVINIFDDDGWV